MTQTQFDELAARYESVELDIGTGDGLFVLDRAREHPDRLVIGLDPVAEAMQDAANRIIRRRTRQDNVLFVVASIEQMPSELTGRCRRVFINLPWGSLMRGLILPAPDILRAVAGVGSSGARFRIILNLRVFEDPVPVEVRDLPEVTVEDVHQRLAPQYAAAGLSIEEAAEIGPSELSRLRTSWARRLSHRTPPPSIRICAARA
jgi:16S rRNA (adenine(1408)-N(1))-methyltransferase